ncbi:MAG TPA: purine-nucleoside phosphorylase [Methylomirabilota bacterium]|nr:purine-nucleoside phosphorylase [Methylomirabilota bacterium]
MQAGLLEQTARRIRESCPAPPRLALVLGSGFGDAFAAAEVIARHPYRRLRGFPSPSVGGHAGELLVVKIGRTITLVLRGRSHYYEGHDMETVTRPVRILARAGVRDMVLTNAAGGINRRLRPGGFMLATDHINLMGVNPLRGVAVSDAERFVDLSEVYDPGLRRLCHRAGRAARVPLRQGVYLAVSGPSYETPAEIRAFARLGADAVGMSTVPEAIVARQCGIRVAAISCITNLAAGRARRSLSHNEVLATGREASQAAGRLLRHFVRLYEASNP